jgi:hypothetical protein
VKRWREKNNNDNNSNNNNPRKVIMELQKNSARNKGNARR